MPVFHSDGLSEKLFYSVDQDSCIFKVFGGSVQHLLRKERLKAVFRYTTPVLLGN